MRSRRVWGGFVFVLGMLWFVGGTFGWFQRKPGAVVFVVCGVVLARMGHRMWRQTPPS